MGLMGNLSVYQKSVPIIDKSSEITLRGSEPVYNKFFVPNNIEYVIATVKLKKPNLKSVVEIYVTNISKIVISVQDGAIPTPELNIGSITVDELTKEEYLQFKPQIETWHYLGVEFENGTNASDDTTKLDIFLKFITGPKNTDDSTTFFSRYRSLRNTIQHKNYDLLRISSQESFKFEFELPFTNGTFEKFVHVSAGEMSVLKFETYESKDIGGTLSIGVGLVARLTKNVRHIKVIVVICISHKFKEIPSYPKYCVSNTERYPSHIVLNNTRVGQIQLIHIPFPDPGEWYISMRAFFTKCNSTCNCPDKCEDKFTTCVKDCHTTCVDNCLECTNNCRKKTSESKGCEGCDNCDGDECQFQEHELNKTAGVLVLVSSHACVEDKCGKHGVCNHYVSGGCLFSACDCFGGYRGWDCSDDSEALSKMKIIISNLFLTLSNLVFIASIYFACRRRYFTEAVVYFFAMFFSTFYHACDSIDPYYSFCMFRINVLQFCDFYCGLLSIWVTLVAMAHVSRLFTSVLHITGAILLAFGTIYNKQSLWVFLMPALGGMILVVVTWGMHCHKTRKMYPAKRYLFIYLPIGSIVVIAGLVCFAFLQTNSNYWVVHSIWHMCMAVCIVFLLPSSSYFNLNNQNNTNSIVRSTNEEQ